MYSRLPILLISLLLSSSQGQDGTLKNSLKEGLHSKKKTLQPEITEKCRSLIIYEEVVPPTIIESDDPTSIILQNLSSEIAQAEIIDAEADEIEEGLREKRRAGRVVIRVCNRRRRRRCRYVIVVRRRGRRRRRRSRNQNIF